METQSAPIGAPSNVFTLVSRQVCDTRRSSTRAPVEQVGDRAHVHDLKTAHGRLLPFPKTAHVRHSKPQRVAVLKRARQSSASDNLSFAESKAAHVQEKTCSAKARVFTATEAAMAYEKLSPGERRRISEEIRALVDAAWFRWFAQRLRETRIGLGISEADAARAAGCLVTTWRKYEGTGRGRCTLAVMAFARHYDLSLDDLLPAE
jgi:hypothetical protein